ncbi:MAG TPA: flagellin [Hyphomonadaceae bacterium]|nr:flagellin [Hyphomonadaceae bacterium]
MLSVNTNYSAMVALQNLNATTSELEVVQNKISTGLKVANAKDNGAVFAIAQGQRARVSGLAAVRDGIDRAINVVDSALNAGAKVSDLLVQLKAKAVAAQSEDLSLEQRNAFNDDFQQLRNTINTIVSTATFNGANLIDNTTPTLRVLQSDLDTGVGAGDVATVTGATKPAGALTPSRSDAVVDASAAWDAANTLVDDDFLVITHGNNTYSVQITTGFSIQELIDGVNAASGGRIIASYDDATGIISYQATGAIATQAFSVSINTAADGSGTARQSNFLNGVAATTAAPATDQPDARPSSTSTILGIDLRVGGTGPLNQLLTLDIGGATTTGATAAAAALTTMMVEVDSALASMGSQSKALDIQKSFLATLSDTVERGVSSLVDADLAKESARLQSLQIKQQLGAQALSIANGAPQVLLSLFRG